MLESTIKNFAQYAPYLAENTKQSLASLVLENMIPDEELMESMHQMLKSTLNNDVNSCVILTYTQIVKF